MVTRCVPAKAMQVECTAATYAFFLFFFPCLRTNYCKLRELTIFIFIFSYYQDLDLRCEELIKEEFGAECNFDVHDAIKKLEKLSIVHRVNQFFLMLKYILLTFTHIKSQSSLFANCITFSGITFSL
jgi:hypothetical protein